MSSRLRSLLTVGGLLGLYFSVLRRRRMTWGASVDDAQARLPGDDLLERGDGISTARSTSMPHPPRCPASLVMERKMLLGIKQPAERLALGRER